MNSSNLIAARPHFYQSGNKLYFFLSKRPYHQLTDAEAEIWQALGSGPVRLDELGDDAAAESLLALKLVDAIEPVATAGRSQILVVEPHSDDAALSIGGTMWTMRAEAEFHLLTMASRSNYTSAFQLGRDFFNREQITALRTAEGELFARQVGGHYYYAGLAEATLRYDDSDWDLDFFTKHRVSVAISNNRLTSERVLESWKERLSEFLARRTFDEIWIPLGAGTHSDHDLARNSALEVLIDLRPSAAIRLYEDVPYGAEFQEHANRIREVLEKAGAQLACSFQDVTDVFSQKLSLLGIFASQFKVPAIRPGVERSAADGERRIERLWTLEALPQKLPGPAMWFGAPEVARAAVSAQALRMGAATARRVAVFAISAAGHWATDLEQLGLLFPNAKFIVYAGPHTCAEFERSPDERVELRCLDGRGISWVGAAIREMLTPCRIIIAGAAMRKARALAGLWPRGRSAVVQDVEHLMQALAN